MIAAWINKLAGTNISYVPYTQMTQGIQDVIAGRVQLVIIAVPTARGHVAAGKLMPLAVTSAEAAAGLPQRAGGGRDLPGLRLRRLVGAGGADRRACADRRSASTREMAAILKDPAVAEKLTNIGFMSRGGGTMQQTRDYVRRSTRPGARW